MVEDMIVVVFGSVIAVYHIWHSIVVVFEIVSAIDYIGGEEFLNEASDANALSSNHKQIQQ